MPTYRRPEDLERCLKAIERLQLAPREVVVVCRRGDDASRVVVERLGYEARLVLVDRPGVLEAMLAGVRATSSELVGFVDDDVQVDVDWAGRVVRHFADARVGGVCGKDRVRDTYRLPFAATVGRIAPSGRLIGNHHLGAGQPVAVQVLKGANMVMRRAALALPRGLRGSGAQVHWEIATCLAATDRGWRLIYDPTAQVEHVAGERFDADLRVRPAARAAGDAAWNYTAVLREFRPGLLVRYVLWQLAVGTRTQPGFLRAARAVIAREPNIAYRLSATVQGVLAATFARSSEISLDWADSALVSRCPQATIRGHRESPT